jgi:hypothetical protein
VEEEEEELLKPLEVEEEVGLNKNAYLIESLMD